MKFSHRQFWAAMNEVYAVTSQHPDQLFLLRLCPEWHRELYAQHLALVDYDLDRISEGPIRLGIGNVQVSRALIPQTHFLTVVEGSTT